MRYVLDTNIFNRILDGTLDMSSLPQNGEFIASYVQIQEINRTKDEERRSLLFRTFAEVRPKMVPTESAVWDVTPWGDGKWGGGKLYERLKSDLDAKNGSRPSNVQDALISEVAVENGYTLMTADYDLAEVVRNIGGNVIHYKS